MSLQTCWGLFFEIRPIFGFFRDFRSAEISQGKIDRQKKLLRVTKKAILSAI